MPIMAFATIVRRDLLAALRRPRFYATLGLLVAVLATAAWPVASFAAIPDACMWLGRGELLGGVHTACVAIALGALLRAAALAHEHAEALRAKEAAREGSAEGAPAAENAAPESPSRGISTA